MSTSLHTHNLPTHHKCSRGALFYQNPNVPQNFKFCIIFFIFYLKYINPGKILFHCFFQFLSIPVSFSCREIKNNNGFVAKVTISQRSLLNELCLWEDNLVPQNSFDKKLIRERRINEPAACLIL